MDTNTEKSSIFRSFIREERKNISLALAGYFICAIIIAVYAVGWEAYLYGGLLCLTFTVVVFTIRFFGYYRKTMRRREYLRDPELNSVPGQEFSDLSETEYHEAVESLRRKCGELENALAKDLQEFNDYYTVWVHQIKTPIAAMQMLLNKEDTKENRELLLQLFRIDQYVEMALGYVRLENGGNDLVLRETDVDEMVRQAIRKFAPQFVEQKLKLVYDGIRTADGSRLMIATDEKWFVFILEQILSNALKYTKQGEISIRYLEDGRLAISDTGMGISAEDLPRIFEKGYTGYNGRADKKATGLGLFLCKRACNMLSIGITAESEQGAGSTFYLDLTQKDTGFRV